MFPKKAFVTFVNERYCPLVEKLIESISLFSSYPIILYTFNFDYTKKHNNVYTKRIDDVNLKDPNFILSTDTSLGIVERSDYNTYYVLSRKPSVILDVLNHGLEEGIFLDADGIVRENIDESFEYLKECENYPLVGKGIFEYMILNGIGDPRLGDPLELPMMNLYDVKHRSMYYVQTNFIVFNKNCCSFFEECIKISNDIRILNNNLLYAPYHDETIINVLLWKYNATKHLPIIHFNLSNCDSIKNFYENPKTDYWVDECAWHYIPKDKNDIKFFHGCKSVSELDNCLEYLKNKIFNMNGFYKNKKRIAIVTLFDKNYADLAKLSIPNKMSYAGKYDYDFIYFNDVIDRTRPAQWGMVKAVESLLLTDKYDWVWWIDLDSLIVNFDIQLESIIDNNYDLIFTANKYSYISNGSAFYRNCDLTKQFLRDAYDLEKPYLKNIDVNVFDHAQQSMRLLLLNEEVYKNRTKMIHERVCNGFCKTNDPNVLQYYPNWNQEDNIYQSGDFIIQFCGRSYQQRLDDFLEYMLPKKIALILFSNDDYIINSQLQSVKNTQFELEIYLSRDYSPNGYASFSQMVNESVYNTKSEYMIFVNPKTVLNENDLKFIIKELMLGKCFASLVGFGLFGTTKSLFKEIGMMDERFLAGEYEDNDFALRLKLFGKAIYVKLDLSKYDYLKHSSAYNVIRGCGLSLFNDKWNPSHDAKTYTITENNMKNKRLPKHIEVDESVKYSWMNFDKSEIHDDYYIFNHLKNYKIKVVSKNKVRSEINGSLTVKFSDTNQFYIEFTADKLHFITVHVNDITHPTIHHAPINLVLCANNWWGVELDSKKRHELKVFSEGTLLYKTILVKPFETVNKFITHIYHFD